MNDLPVVSVWRDAGAEWRWVADIGDYTDLTFAPALHDVGSWSMTVPYAGNARNLVPGRLVTIDWRDTRTTWDVGVFGYSEDDTGQTILEVSGVGALGRLGWDLAWPDPTTALDVQNQPSDAAKARYYGISAEAVVKRLVGDNFVARRGEVIAIPASAGRGSVVHVVAHFDNILELVLKKATAGDIGVDLGLVSGTGTRAQLTLDVWEPQDKSKSVQLTQLAGTLAQWSDTDSAPTVTSTIVGTDAASGLPYKRLYLSVGLPDPATASPGNVAGVAAAQSWGGQRVAFVDSSGGSDTGLNMPQITDDGDDAIAAGVGGRALSMVAAEAEGMRAFVHYNVGDLATAQVVSGEAIVDVISSIAVSVSADSGAVVTPTFGDPNAADPQKNAATVTRDLRRRVRHLETS